MKDGGTVFPVAEAATAEVTIVPRYADASLLVRFQVLTAANMKFRIVFWDVLPCKIIVDRRFRGTMMEAARASETSVDNYFTRLYNPEDNSELLVSLST
jgi:hypothetical protein